MSDTLTNKNGEPLTDAEMDAYLSSQPSTDTAALERIRTRLEALIAEAKDIEPTPKADLLAALRREWERSQ